MNKKKEVMLILTEGCNLACSYCFEHYKTHKNMDFETAKRIIDQEMTSEDGTEECQFTMFGGEPFLEFDLIRKIYDYIEKNISTWNKRAFIFVNTNGTLTNEEAKEWLEKRKKYIVCGLSLDGTKEMHDRNRSGSFDKIDLEFYKKCWPGQLVKMTVSKETLPMLAEGVMFIHELGYGCGCTFAYGIEWSQRLIEVLEEQLEILVNYYIDHPEVKLCKILDIDFAGILKTPQTNFKRCGAGTAMKAYDTEGNLYPCHTFSPVGLGEEAARFINYKLPETDIVDEEHCIQCKYYLICPTCYGANYIYTGSVSKRSQWLCEFFKLCVKASAHIQLWRLKDKNANDYELHDYATLKAIESIIKLDESKW